MNSADPQQPPLLGVVLGSPVSRSLSPAIHEAAFRAAGRPGRFEAWECTAAELPVTLGRLRATGALGASITMPLKNEVVGLCDDLDATASVLRAVNCLSLRHGRVTGHNTDGDGCCDALAHIASLSFEGLSAVVLGAGGTAASVALALARRGARVAVVNRTAARAHDVAGLGRFVDHPVGAIRVGGPEDVADSALLVNATSVGMGSDECPVAEELLHGGLTVLDAVYQPLETLLLRRARAAGARVVDGLWMLIEQARRQQVIWFGELPEAGPMRAESLRVLAERPN